MAVRELGQTRIGAKSLFSRRFSQAPAMIRKLHGHSLRCLAERGYR
jgi:hypothetical protein